MVWIVIVKKEKLMWGNTQPKVFSSLKNCRLMYTSKNGHQIFYNDGSKDSFQVSILEGQYAYAMGDVDYFGVVQKYYVGNNISKIDGCLEFFTKLIDNASGNFYDTYKGFPKSKPYYFDITKNTFGYDTLSIQNNLNNFKHGYTQLAINENDSELEEALVIIYLAMISEWYYGFDYNCDKFDTGRRSKWQHRMKLLGLKQVFFGGYSPKEAANWSKHKKTEELSTELKKYNIYDQQIQLK